MRKQRVPQTLSVPDPDPRPVRHNAQGKRHGVLTAGHNDEGQEGAPEGDQKCDAEHDQTHGVLPAGHKAKGKRP